MTAPTTAPTGSRPSTAPARRRLDALATPWSGTSLPAPATGTVDFSDVPAPFGAVRMAAVALDTPWQRHAIQGRLVPSAVPPVDFSGLPAPVVPPRPDPLVVRDAFVPVPRGARLSGRS